MVEGVAQRDGESALLHIPVGERRPRIEVLGIFGVIGDVAVSPVMERREVMGRV